MMIVFLVLLGCSMLGVLLLLGCGRELNQADDIAARWTEQQRWRSLATTPTFAATESRPSWNESLPVTRTAGG